MTDKEYQEFIEEYGDVSNYIKDKVDKYRDKEEQLQNDLKILFFIYLLNKADSKSFNKEVDKYIRRTEISQNKAINRELEQVSKIMQEKNIEIAERYKRISADISEIDVNKLFYKLDNKSVARARETMYKVLTNYYDSSLKTIKKEFINEEEYLSKKVSQYDKITKVVPYYFKDPTREPVYHSFASYNAMVQNTNLTRSALNKTIEQVGELGNDLLYVEPHMFSCPMCIPYQGKVLSMTGKSFLYPSLESAMNNGLLHPNCTHEIVGYWDESQRQQNNYDSAEWEEKYKTRQKVNAVNREIEKEKTDKTIYKKIGNQEKVDKCNSKLKNLYAKRRELKS